MVEMTQTYQTYQVGIDDSFELKMISQNGKCEVKDEPAVICVNWTYFEGVRDMILPCDLNVSNDQNRNSTVC